MKIDRELVEILVELEELGETVVFWRIGKTEAECIELVALWESVKVLIIGNIWQNQ